MSEELAHWSPAGLTAWRFRRVLKAVYWDGHLLVTWWVEKVLQTLPPPKDGTLSRGRWQWETQAGDAESLDPKRAKKRASAVVFGIRFVLLIATWDVYRLPMAFRLIRVKTPPESRMDNTLFREMVRHCGPPVWAKRMIVEGDAASGSQENMQMGMQRDADAPARLVQHGRSSQNETY